MTEAAPKPPSSGQDVLGRIPGQSHLHDSVPPAGHPYVSTGGEATNPSEDPHAGPGYMGQGNEDPTVNVVFLEPTLEGESRARRERANAEATPGSVIGPGDYSDLRRDDGSGAEAGRADSGPVFPGTGDAGSAVGAPEGGRPRKYRGGHRRGSHGSATAPAGAPRAREDETGFRSDSDPSTPNGPVTADPATHEPREGETRPIGERNRETVAATAGRLRRSAQGGFVAGLGDILGDTVKSPATFVQGFRKGHRKELLKKIMKNVVSPVVLGGIAARVGLGMTTAFSAEAIGATVGATTSVLLGRQRMLERVDGHQARLSRKIGRLVALGVRGAALGAAGAHFSGAVETGVKDAASWVGDKAAWVGDKVGDLTGGGGDHTPTPSDGAPNPSDGTTGSQGTPPAESGGGQAPTAPELTTDKIGKWDGKFDADTNYYNGTGYNAIAHELMDAYKGATGQEMDWQELRYNNEGFDQAYHKFVGDVLKHNDLTWEDARHMSAGDKLDVPPDALEKFVGKLGKITDGEFKTIDFGIVDADATNGSGATGQGGSHLPAANTEVGVDSGSGGATDSTTTGQTRYADGVVEVSNGHLAGALEDDVTFASNTAPTFTDQPYAGYAAGSIPQNNPEGAGVLNNGFAVQEQQTNDIVLRAAELNNASEALTTGFKAYMESAPPRPSDDLTQYIDNYLSTTSAENTYNSLHDAAVREELRRTLQAVLEEHLNQQDD